MATNVPPENGLSDFWSAAEELRRFWAWIVASAALPFLASLSKIAPPWPPAISILTSSITVLAIVVAYQFFRNSSQKTVNRLIAVGIVLLFTFGFLYLATLSEMTFAVPGSDTDRVKGFACTDFANISFPNRCPWFGESELRQSEWTPENLWLSWSITLVRMVLITLWLASFLLISLVLASFIVFQRRSRTTTRAV
jgi:hypothetical protein